MKGSVILEKIGDPLLRQGWHFRLDKLHSALCQLNNVKKLPYDETSELEYLEAVLRFAEARDDERNFFWDAFVENRFDHKHPRT